MQLTLTHQDLEALAKAGVLRAVMDVLTATGPQTSAAEAQAPAPAPAPAAEAPAPAPAPAAEAPAPAPAQAAAPAKKRGPKKLPDSPETQLGPELVSARDVEPQAQPAEPKPQAAEPQPQAQPQDQSGDGPGLEELRAALMRVSQRQGLEAAVAVLSSYGVARVSDLLKRPADVRKAFVEACHA